MKDLLEDRTCNIILLCKRFGEPDNVKKAIAQYMSEECWCEIETYTEPVLYSILRTAMFDFLHHASRKKDTCGFVRELTEGRFPKLIDNMIIAFGMMQVKEKQDWEYVDINGWHETEFTKKLDAEEWKLK